MWTRRPAGALHLLLVLLLLCAALAGCGSAAAPDRVEPGDREAAAAEAVVERLAGAMREDDALVACRTLTLATRRVVGLVGPPGASCPSGLDEFLLVRGLRSTLPEVRGAHATVTGARAVVRAPGLAKPLVAARNAGRWRVSLVGLPGVLGDVRAARACGRYVDAADALGLPPFAPGALGARLRMEARLLDRLRRRLAALPSGGPPRLELPQLLVVLGAVRSGLRGQAGQVDAGADVARGMEASARADRLVRRLLGGEGRRARVACPLDATAGPELASRRSALDRACGAYVGVIDALDADPATAAEARAGLRRVDEGLRRLDRRLRAVPGPVGLRRLRAASRRAVGAMRAAVVEFGTATGAAFDAAARRVEGHGAQIDAALIRLGARCVDRRGPPRVTPEPPSPAPQPAPRRGPPGTVES